MAYAEEVQEFGLISKDIVTASDISCVHVKLTDSALKVIEDTLRLNKTSRPTIEINDDNGVIRIPALDGSGYKEFVFNVGPLAGDPNGSFDCIKQTRLGTREKMEQLDAMNQKIVVQATEDVYKNTKDRLAEQNEESKKSRANVIDQTKGGIRAKRITKTIKRNGITPPPTNKPAEFNHHINNISGSPSRPGNTSLSQHAPNNNPNQLFSSQADAAKKVEQMRRKNVSKRLNTQQKAAHAPKVTSKSEKEKVKAAMLAAPLRERLLHMLALKPHYYTTPVLLVRLKNEGATDTLSDVTNTLEAVGIKNSKECWSLKPQNMAEVDVNWTFYSDTDRQLVKRNLQNTSSKPVQQSPSPTPDIFSQPEPPKRKLKEEKSQKPERIKRRKSSSRDKEDHDESHNGTTNGYLEETFDKSRWRKPKTEKQRNAYKAEFNRFYPEYIKRFEENDKIQERFATLAERLNCTSPDSNERKKIEKKIKKEYKVVKEDPAYNQTKSRLEFLHQKLSHLKQTVADFDAAALINSQTG